MGAIDAGRPRPQRTRLAGPLADPITSEDQHGGMRMISTPKTRARAWRGLLLGLLGGVAGALVSCGKADAPSRESAAPLNVLLWSEYIDPDLVSEFAAETGIPVRISTYESTDEMLAKLQHAGGTDLYDVVVAPNQSIPTMARLGLLRELDHAAIPNLGNLSARFRDPSFDRGLRYCVPYQWGTVGLVWDRTKLPDFRPSWAAFFDPARRPARFLFMDESRDVLGGALKLRGRSVNEPDPEAVREAAHLVLDAKADPRCVGFDGGVGAIGQVIAGAADLAMGWNGDALRLAEDADARDRIAFGLPEEGGFLWVDAMTIPSGAPNVGGAHRFIDFILRPEIGARLSDYVQYATPNEASRPLVEARFRDDPTIYPDDATLESLETIEDLGERSRTYDEAWTEIKAR